MCKNGKRVRAPVGPTSLVEVVRGIGRGVFGRSAAAVGFEPRPGRIC